MSLPQNIENIVVIGTQRSGTTWLMQVLKQIPQFQVYGEVFREIYSSEFKGDQALQPPKFYLDYSKDLGYKPTCIRYIKDVLEVEGKITIFKVMYDQIRRNPRLWYLISNKNTLVINMERDNIFEIAISKCIARNSGIFHTQKQISHKGFYIQYKSVFRLIIKERLKALFFPAAIKAVSSHYIYVVYEKLLVDFAPIISAVEEHTAININNVDPHNTKWKKTEQNEKHKTVINFNEINQKLSKSIFRRYAK